jgi:hypothetical protein
VFSLLSVSDDFLSKYNSMTNSNELILPVTSFQRHISTYSASEIEPIIFVNSAKKDVKRMYTVFSKNRTAVQPFITGTRVIQYPEFRKGTNNSKQRLARFQTRYQDVNYPEQHVSSSVNSLGRVTDQNKLLEHLLTNISPEIAHKSPYIASLSTTETLKIRSIFEQELILVTDYYPPAAQRGV